MFLEAHAVHKTYVNGKRTLEVLRGVDFSVTKGSFVAIVGPSGAGKSTFLHILGGLDTPTKGSVVFEGQEFSTLSDAQISRVRNSRIGFVFQFYHLMPEFTVLENVLMPGVIGVDDSVGRATMRQRAQELLSQAGLIERMHHFPAQLSGGEKQRVAIVRGLINKPALLLCDEPTGNLDSKTGDEIMSLIKRVHQQRQMTVILVTHNSELAKSAHAVYHLYDGVLKNPGG